MKIAICQFEILFEQKEENIKNAEQFVKEAAHKGAKLVLFPEMSFTGFSMNVQITGEKAAEAFVTCALVKKWAIQYGIGIGFGWVELAQKARNHYTVFDDKGKLLADYVKIHPFRYSGEHELFQAGDRVVTFTYQGICFGVSICYDLRFPEIYQEMSKTAHVILVAANWPEARSQHWRTLLFARAIENQCYMIGINCFGRQQKQYYSGNSCVVTPQGEAEFAIDDRQEMYIYELTDDVEELRADFPMKEDRRCKLYKNFYED